LFLVFQKNKIVLSCMKIKVSLGGKIPSESNGCCLSGRVWSVPRCRTSSAANYFIECRINGGVWHHGTGFDRFRERDVVLGKTRDDTPRVVCTGGWNTIILSTIQYTVLYRNVDAIVTLTILVFKQKIRGYTGITPSVCLF
jgi:hypothetical protein